MTSANNVLVRLAQPADFVAIAAVERATFGAQGIEPYGEDHFDAWHRTNPKGFIIGEVGGEVVSYVYAQMVNFDPDNRPIDMSYDTLTDHGYTVRTNNPCGNSCHAISGASISPKAGRSVAKAGIEAAINQGASYHFLLSRMSGFAAWFDKQDCIPKREAVASKNEYALALWYAKENARITKSHVWPEVSAYPFRLQPRVAHLDPVLAIHLKYGGHGLLDVLPSSMTDAMSRDFSALLVKRLTP